MMENFKAISVLLDVLDGKELTKEEDDLINQIKKEMPKEKKNAKNNKID